MLALSFRSIFSLKQQLAVLSVPCYCSSVLCCLGCELVGEHLGTEDLLWVFKSGEYLF